MRVSDHMGALALRGAVAHTCPMRKQHSLASSLPCWPEAVVGGKYMRMLEHHLRALRAADTHGNRQLFYDDVLIAHLLAFFNPTLRSLRTLEDFSQTRQAQRHLSVRKLCKNTMADFHRVVEPTLLEPIIDRLHTVAVGRGLALRRPGL